jgi:hypothetical protein
MLEVLLMENGKVMDNIIGQTEIFIKVIFPTICEMEMENSLLLMELNRKDYLKMEII